MEIYTTYSFNDCPIPLGYSHTSAFTTRLIIRLDNITIPFVLYRTCHINSLSKSFNVETFLVFFFFLFRLNKSRFLKIPITNLIKIEILFSKLVQISFSSLRLNI